MKKMLVFCLTIFTGIITLNAECEYKELRELNTLASHVQTNYEYNENTKKFDITVTNLSDKFYVVYENKRYEPSSGTTIISGIDEGTRVLADVVVSLNSECFNEVPRNLFINVPYVNQYYKSNLCDGHETLNVCNSRFLDYKISESTFLKLISEDKKEQDINKNPDDDKNKVERPTIIDKTVEVVKNYSIPFIIVVVVSGITISIYEVIIRKIKHGL